MNATVHDHSNLGGLIHHTRATEMASVYARNTAAIFEHLDALRELHQGLRDVFFEAGAFGFDINTSDLYRDDTFPTLQRSFKRAGWRALIEKLEVRKYMCSSDQEKLDAALSGSGRDANQRIDEYPEITAESIMEVLAGYASSAPDFLDRAICEEWDFWLPRRDTYVANQEKWKVSKKIIHQSVMRTWDKKWDTEHRINHDARKHVTGLDNVFHLLDGKGFTREGNGPLYNAIYDAAKTGTGETDYFRFRCFQNGNIHLWVKRLDLLDKFNEIGCGEGSTGLPNPPGGVEKTSPLETPPQSFSGGLDFFETPSVISDHLVHLIDDHFRVKPDHGHATWRIDDRRPRALDPTAGRGLIARKLHDRGCDVFCVELDPQMAKELDREYCYNGCECVDFLKKEPTPVMDVVAMNPPFSGGRDEYHTYHAYKFVRRGGILVSIMSPHWRFANDKLAVAFREWVGTHDAKWYPLPSGSFKASGTLVETGILKIVRSAVRGDHPLALEQA